MKEYLVTFNSTRWAGSDFHKIIEAESLEEAEELAEVACNEHMLELYYDEDQDLDSFDDEAAAEIISIEKYDKYHPLYKYRNSIES